MRNETPRQEVVNVVSLFNWRIRIDAGETGGGSISGQDANPAPALAQVC